MNFSKIDNYLDNKCKSKNKSPGAAICILKNNKIIYEKYYGYQNVEKKIKNNKNTNFRLASVTKQFTAFLTLKLIEKNKINFSTKLTEIFPNFPQYAKEITIYHLLTHSSGLKQYKRIIKEKKLKESLDDKMVFEILSKEKKLLFNPGTKFDYNDGGYCLLRLMIEKISRMRFENFLRKEIFKPLKINNSTTNQNKKIKNRAYGYSLINRRIIKTDQSQTSRTLGDGGIYSSIKDLIRWCNALENKRLLNKNLYKKYESIQKSSDKRYLGYKDYGFYSMGWFIKNKFNKKIIFHGGESIGFRSAIYRIPQDKITIIFLSNLNKYEGYKIAEDIYNSLDFH